MSSTKLQHENKVANWHSVALFPVSDGPSFLTFILEATNAGSGKAMVPSTGQNWQYILFGLH